MQMDESKPEFAQLGEETKAAKLAEIEKFTFETSHVFHYTDDVQGTAKVALHAYYHDSALSEIRSYTVLPV